MDELSLHKVYNRRDAGSAATRQLLLKKPTTKRKRNKKTTTAPLLVMRKTKRNRRGFFFSRLPSVYYILAFKCAVCALFFPLSLLFTLEREGTHASARGQVQVARRPGHDESVASATMTLSTVQNDSNSRRESEIDCYCCCYGCRCCRQKTWVMD